MFKRMLYINAFQELSGLSPGSPMWFATEVNWMMTEKSRWVVQEKIEHAQTGAVHYASQVLSCLSSGSPMWFATEEKLDDVGEIR